ncbi:hypothetical protein ACFQ36_18690, partial [Arthrobacter sp. GCM10027362]
MTSTRGSMQPGHGFRRKLLAPLAAALAAMLALSGCTGPGPAGETGASAAAEAGMPQRSADQVYLNTAPAAPQLVSGADAQAALAASQVLFDTSPLAVTAPAADPAAVTAAAREA